MFYRSAFFRVLVIPACVVWGLVEFLALQRAHVSMKRLKPH
jgi:hypothetical protein